MTHRVADELVSRLVGSGAKRMYAIVGDNLNPVTDAVRRNGKLQWIQHQGKPLVKGKHVTSFTNGEEEEMKLTNVVPFLVEDELLRLGAIFEKKADWQPFSITDGRLVTEKNPASSAVTAQALLKLVGQKAAA